MNTLSSPRDLILEQLTPQQRAAAASDARVTRVVACAGAGKTETMARRVLLALEGGVEPEQIVAFTFTERAASEMKSRILERAGQFLGAGLRDRLGALSVGTLHAFAFRLLQEHGGLRNHDLLNPHQERAFLVHHARALSLDRLGNHPFPGNLELFRRSIAAAYNEDIDRSKLRRRSPEFADALDSYERLLEDHRLLTFDRVVALAVNLLRRAPESRPPLGHLLVDEYQDINPAQEALIHLLAGDGARLFVVGDPNQCIYEWRGSDPACFDRLPRHYRDTRTFTLSENRRSRPGILQAANLYGRAMARGNWVTMAAVRPDAPPAVWGTEHTTADEELEDIVERIRREHAQGRPWRDMAILLGSVDSGGTPFLDRFRELGIPCEVGGRSGLFRHPTAQGLGRIFAWLADHAWRAERYGSDQIEGDDLLESALGDCLDLEGPALLRARQGLRTLKRRAWETRFDNFIDLYYEILRALGILSLDPTRPQDEQRIAHMGRFSTLLNDFEAMIRRVSADPARGRGSRLLDWPRALNDFAWHLTGYATNCYEESDATSSGEDAVLITTIHQAKGLEWPLVFLPGLLGRRFPTRRRNTPGPWLFDESLFDSARYAGDEASRRRVLYVALTRARDGLFLSWFREGNGKRSPFLDPVMEGMHPPAATLETRVPPPPESRRESAPVSLFTPTELILWRTCPHLYRLTQIWGFQAGLTPELGYGRANHHVMQRLADLLRAGRKLSPALVRTTLDESFYLPHAPAGMREDMKSRALDRIQDFVATHREDLKRVERAESHLEFPLGASLVQGTIDVLLAGENELEVRDYKTGEDPLRQGQSDFQVQLYSAGLRKTGKRVTRGSVASFDSGEIRAVDVSPARLDSIEHEAVSIIGEIEAGRFPARPGEACAGCDFRSICPSAQAAEPVSCKPARAVKGA